jgi:hypothetical protein
MTKQVCQALLIATGIVLVAPQPADAGLLSWLGRLSGPGPFYGLDVGICVNQVSLVGPVKPEQRDPEAVNQRVMAETLRFPCTKYGLDQPHLSINLNVGAAIAEDNPLDYGDVNRREHSTAVRYLKGGVSFDLTVLQWLDVGVGAGMFYFAGPSFANFSQGYLEPARISVRPLLIRRNLTKPQRERGAWLGLSLSRVIHLGTLDGASFGAPNDPYRVHNEANWQGGVSIDVFRFTSFLKGS